MSASRAVTVTEINDPTSVGEGFRELQMDAVLLHGQSLQARRVMIQLPSSTLVYHWTSQALRTRTTVPHGRMAFATFGPKSTGTADGMAIDPGHIYVASGSSEVCFVVAANYEGITFLTPSEFLEAQLKARGRNTDKFRFNGSQLVRSNGFSSQELHALRRRVVDTAVQRPEVFEDPQTKLAVEVELIDGLLAALGPADDGAARTKGYTHQCYSELVKRAEEYALSHTDSQIHVSDLCVAMAVSERTLENAFNEVMGMPPKSYLMRVRLHRVRQALRTAAPHATSVTREAMRWGFWHFGDFSRSYKKCFGESPSKTLRQRG